MDEELNKDQLEPWEPCKQCKIVKIDPNNEAEYTGTNDNKYLECGKCSQWTHPTCDNINNDEYEKIEKYYCKRCRTRNRQITYKIISPEKSSEENEINSSVVALEPPKIDMLCAPSKNPVQKNQRQTRKPKTAKSIMTEATDKDQMKKKTVSFSENEAISKRRNTWPKEQLKKNNAKNIGTTNFEKDESNLSKNKNECEQSNEKNELSKEINEPENVSEQTTELEQSKKESEQNMNVIEDQNYRQVHNNTNTTDDLNMTEDIWSNE